MSSPKTWVSSPKNLGGLTKNLGELSKNLGELTNFYLGELVFGRVALIPLCMYPDFIENTCI